MTFKNDSKKVVAILLFIIMLFSFMSFESMSAFADTQTVKSYGAFNYRVTEDGVHIVKYTGDMTEVFIPNTIDDGVVVGIDDEAFWYKDKLTNVNLPEYLETIGERAFQGCSSLTEITLPDTVYEISDAAFESCTSLESINIPADLGYVGAFAFDGTRWIQKFEDNTSIIFGGRVFYKYLGNAPQVVIPNGVISISANAFDSNKTLSYVSIPDTVAIIGNFAFFNCPNLKSVSLPSSLYLVGEHTFGCYEDTENQQITVYDDFVIYSDTEDSDGEELVASKYCKERGIELLSPSKHATPDELPSAEVCRVKESQEADVEQDTDGARPEVWLTVVLIVSSCVVVIGGIFVVTTIAEKKRKKNIKKNNPTHKKR